MSKRNKSREKEYSIFYCVISSFATAVAVYVISSAILAIFVNSGKLSVNMAHYAVCGMVGIGCCIGVAANVRKNRENRFLTAIITAAIITCMLLVLPLTDSRGVGANLSWHGIVLGAIGCILPAAFTKRIPTRRKRK